MTTYRVEFTAWNRDGTACCGTATWDGAETYPASHDSVDTSHQEQSRANKNG